ncbi:MAG: phosphoenolpyruvate synthase [Bacteroidia bacterium]|nr:phosphoenolpyruvate synthase [Bacteroidia bacterium]
MNLVTEDNYKVYAEPKFFGGKAKRLLELSDQGFNIPHFILIPADVLAGFISEEFTGNQEKTISLIKHFNFPVSLLTFLKSRFEPDTLFAVRSSATNEDGDEKSYAGMYQTKLYVQLEHIDEAIREVWLSGFNERVTVYNDEQPVQMAVIVQQMINATVSGVAFGINPVSGSKDEKIINAVYGLGEGLVSGYLSADQFIVNHTNLITEQNAIEKHMAVKSEKFVLDEKKGFGLIKIKVPLSLQLQPGLSDQQLYKICDMLDRLSLKYNAPQDIEFAYEKEVLYLLQTRPVTAVKANKPSLTDQKITVWDNSNIIESYPGLTLPLTFSFITKMYESVYKQLSAVMGIRQQVINANAPQYANMLGIIYGRVYYNLNSWYGALALLPGYSLNVAFMEKMMGVKEKFTHHQIPKKSNSQEWFDIIYAVLRILWNLFTIKEKSTKFQAGFQLIYDKYQALNFDSVSLTELLIHYRTYEQNLLKKWKPPLVNDFFAMVFYGMFNKMCNHKKYGEFKNLQNALLIGSNDIISTGPAVLLSAIIKSIKSENASDLFTNNSSEQILKLLETGIYPQTNNLIQQYLEKWGARCVGELKLETKTYIEAPEKLIAMIRNTLADLQPAFNNIGLRMRIDAELFVTKKNAGNPFKKLLFNYVLKQTRYFVSNRENLRYERTRAYSVVRKICNAAGKKLYHQKVLELADDIFYLTFEELEDYANGKSVHPALMEIAALRKKAYTGYEHILLPERIVAKGVVYLNIILGSNNTPVNKLQVLKGLPCCSGIVRAKVKVLHHADEATHMNGHILVTSSTDPGWVPLFVSAAGILVERGSMLSHSAIVSREMGLPCIVGITGLMQQLKSGDLVEMNGATGEIIIIERC